VKKLPEEVREAAAIFGRMGGKAAGKKMTKEARVARAKKAAQARWARLEKRDRKRAESVGPRKVPRVS
jgi:hypothetical protein